MFRARDCAILGIGLMLAAASTQARELELSVETRMGGENNVFRTSDDKKSDGFWELTPGVALRTRNKKLNYDFNYRPTYSTYMETSGVDGFDHRAQGLVSWRPTARDTIDLTGNFRSLRLIRADDVTGPTDPAPVIEESDRERLQISDVNLSYRRNLSARWSVQLNGGFNDFDYSRSDSIDSRGYSIELRTQYGLDPRTFVGLSGSYRRRDSTSDGVSRPDQATKSWNVAAFVQYDVTPTINVLLQAGPTFFDTTQEFSTPLVSDQEDSRVSYFAFGRIQKRWQHSKASLAYTRSESPGGGSATASILDDVRLDVDHRFDRLWSMRLSATWVKREEISEVGNLGRDETTQWLGYATLTRQITNRISVSAQYSFIYQDQNQRLDTESIGAVHTGYVSLRYTFDPIVF